MLGAYRRRVAEEEEESAFVSMTDMTVSFLFIVMILLAFFITHFSDEDIVPRDQFEAMRDERNEARALADTRTRERDTALAELEAARAQLNRVTRERDAALAELEGVRAELDRVTRERNAALADLETAHSEIAELRAALRQVEEERDRLHEELDRAERAIADRDELITQLRSEIAELEQRLRELEVRDPLERYLSRASATRLRILEELRDRIRVDFPNLLVEISAESDALRFQGEGLFRTGESVLDTGPRRIVETIADRLSEILPCYTLGAKTDWDSGCNPADALIEAVQIEGHTDSQGSDLSNLYLSTARANATFEAMIARQTDLTAYLNFRHQPVLSVAGYGEMRPVAPNDTIQGRATNRRIDLRIIMYTPTASEEIDQIRAHLAGETASEEDAPP